MAKTRSGIAPVVDTYPVRGYTFGMGNEKIGDHRAFLEGVAIRAMDERGLRRDFGSEVMAELERKATVPPRPDSATVDMRDMPWCSIDNVDSRDLDQLTVAEKLRDDAVRIHVAIADVDAYVTAESALDLRALENTSTVYTAARIFPMIPERLSTDLTSLNLGEDRLAMVMSFDVDARGELSRETVGKALVRNHARLDYDSVAAWLDGEGPLPAGVARVAGLEANLRDQDATGAILKRRRAERGSLEFESREWRPRFEGNRVVGLVRGTKNRASSFIENFMVAANGAVARFLAGKGYPSLARVVRTPKRWDRIAVLAAERGFDLSPMPDPVSLSAFLASARRLDPATFGDLSLAVVKLLGAGEYAATDPGSPGEGHFGLAVREYAHSTAPNRRYADLVTHRLVKGALAGAPPPYPAIALAEIGARCTDRENAINKVERQVAKSAAALFMGGLGEATHGAVVTGAAAKGTWVRLRDIPVEGRLLGAVARVDVGDAVRVRLLSADAEAGHLDFGPA